MKTFRILWLLIVLWSVSITTSVFGQTVYTWVGSSIGDIFQPTNWNPNGYPIDANPDQMLWDGQTLNNAGNPDATVSVQALNQTAVDGSHSHPYGLEFVVGPNQGGATSVTLMYTNNPAGVSDTAQRSGDVTNLNTSGAVLNFGDGSSNILDTLWGATNGQVQNWYNANTNANTVVIWPDVRFRMGGAGKHTFLFSGPGNFVVSNYLASNNGSAVMPEMSGTGTLYWNPCPVGGGNSFQAPTDPLGGPININSGTVVLQSGDIFTHTGISSNLILNSMAVINNNGTLLEYDAGNGLHPAGTISLNINGTGPLQVNSGTLTLSGTNTYSGGTIISGGTLQVGTNGTSGSVGSGPVTNNSVLIFNRSDNVTLTNVISGTGSLVQQGTGTLLLDGVNTYTGSTTVSNGVFGGTGTLAGPVILNPGTTLAPGASVGTLTINNDLTIGGNLAIEVNKSLAQSNDLVVVSGVLTNTGTGTLTVANLGPALAAGDTFTLFSQPVQNGAALTVTGAGASWSNNLAVDGSISVFIAAPTLNVTQAGGSLQFTWTGSFKLQSQTNTLDVGLGTNWSDYPGGGTSPVPVPVDAMNETVFFRLISTP